MPTQGTDVFGYLSSKSHPLSEYHIKRQHVLDTVILYLLMPALLVDTINGYFMLKGSPLPISQAYKFMLLLLMIARNLCFASWVKSTTLFLLAYLSLHLFFSVSVFSNNFADTLKIFNHLLRFIFFYTTFAYLYAVLHNDPENMRIFKRIIIFNLFILLGNLALGLGGFGYPIYELSDGEISVGVKGFFYAGNELSVVFLLLMALFMSLTGFFSKRMSFFAAASGAVIFFSITLATKTAIAGAIILVTIAIFFRKRLFAPRSLSFSRLLSLLFALIVILPPAIYAFVQSTAYERFLYYYQQYNELATFLLSSRDQYLGKNLSLILSRDDLLSLMIGVGKQVTVEMDFFDTFLNYGLLGVFVIYAYYLSIYSNIWKRFLRGGLSYQWAMVGYTAFMLFLVSFVSGHVLYSGLAAIPYALCCVLAVSEVEMAPSGADILSRNVEKKNLKDRTPGGR